MNYKETLYFIAKCLTIYFEERNKEAVERQLKLNNIDWNNVVKVSTAHNVLPALYCNLHRCKFTHYLSDELVHYMKYITNLNRMRNKKIITQARELNALLLANNITPIFLKGTANLLSKIYKDIAERMVGDIDFIFSKEDYPKAIKLLKSFGYYEVKKYDYHFPGGQHYGRLQKKNHIAAVEIHSEILSIEKYRKDFDYIYVEKDSQIINEVRVLSYANKLNLSIISDQINDRGFYFKRIALKNAYDVFLLSKKVNAKKAVNTLNKLYNPLNCFLAACYEVFNQVNSLQYNNTKMTTYYLNDFNDQFINPTSTKIQHKLIKTCLFIRSRLNIIYKSLMYEKYRVWLFNRLTDKEWFKGKLDQMGCNKLKK